MTETDIPQPKRQVEADDRLKADQFLQFASEGTAVIWRGDFHNAKQLLQAVDRRMRPPQAENQSPLDLFHRHRQFRGHRARVLSKLFVEINADFTTNLKRSPDVQFAIQQASLNEPPPFLISLRELLGMIGASQWREKGVQVDVLGEKIFPHYGVFAPVRQEYLELVKNAPLPPHTKTAFDIGTGTGVLSALLARRKIPRVIATDLDQRAINCATENLTRLKLNENVLLQKTDLFPNSTADLIVCNPPWIPARPTSRLERAIFDEKSQMLKGFLSELPKHLNPQGEAWLIISNFAELIGLRAPREIDTWIADANLQVVEILEIKPQHPKAKGESDVLSPFRQQEVTRLFRISLKN